MVAFLENFFARYVEYDFTAALEEQLDRVSNNEISWQQVLHDFWRGFIGAVNDIKDLRVAEVLDALDDMLGPHIYAPRADGGDPRQCPTCGTGKLNLKAGKFGAFVGCTNYPECRYTRPLAADSEASADRVLGQDPETGRDVIVKAGRFGPYIQLGEQKDYAEGEKPKRAGIPKNISPSDIELDLALKLLSLPREIGLHPESGQPITAGLGRFGPFVKHEKTYASLEAGDEVFDIGLNRAVTLIAEKVAKGPSGRRFGADPGKPLGDHPSLGAVAVKNGRYGAYVTAGGINATIPSDKTVDTITLPEAIALIDERAAKGGGSKRGARKAAKPAKAAKPEKAAKSKVEKPEADAAAAKPAKKVAAKKSAAKPKAEATSKARAPVTAKTFGFKDLGFKGRQTRRQEECGQSKWIRQADRVARQRDSGFPSTEAIVAFVRAYPGKIGTREIAREFGLKNADRVALKQLLRELADEGIIKKRGKEVSEPETLPATLLADITSRDSDGELIAVPAEWDEVENSEPPKIRIHMPRRTQPGTAAGVGDRALLRVEKLEDGIRDGVAYRGRILKVIDHGKTRVLGIFRKNADGSGRLIPVDKKQAGRELNIAKTDTLSAEDGDLVSVDLVRSRGFGLK